jgi:TolA-binding protein
MKSNLKGTASPLALLLLFASGAGLALGCGWFGTERSVRFNRWRSERQFSRLPPLPFDARGKKTPDEGDDDGDAWESYESRSKETDAVWASAGEAAGQGDFAKARKLLRDYVERTGGGACRDDYDAPADCLARRNSARDRLDALAALDRGAPTRAVASYLEARRAYDEWLEGRGAKADAAQASPADAPDGPATEERVSAALDAVPREPNLEDNVAYLRAAVLYRGGEDDAAAEAFARLAARHVRSEKRAAALYMVGVIRLHQSLSTPEEYGVGDEPCADCRDDAWASAYAAFERVIRESPRGPYASDARGWLAYLRLRVGEKAGGLAEYYRMLAEEGDADGREEALRSLAIARGAATEDDMARVESLIEDEPRAALAYAYHDIYNVATRGGLGVEVPEERNPYKFCKDRDENPCWSSFYAWEEKERGRLEEDARRKELARVAAFATRLMLRGNAGGGAFALRVAQADLELGEDKSARALAARALAAGPRGNERASALWVRGVAEYRLKETAAARRTFESLIAEFPEGDLTEGARRYVAMAAEDSGDLDAALEQYLALDYTDDAAYFVDVLLTPEHLASFIESHPDSPSRDVLLYSLGVRHMRDHRFAAARAAYARVRTSEEGLTCGYDPSCGCDDDDPPPRCGDVKNPRYDDAEGVRAAWVARDLKTMDDIEHLEERASAASGEEARAEALYQLASYLYESSQLAFYNPAVWKGERFYAFYYDQRFRAPGEAQLMRRYMERHEPVVRALEIYLRVAEEYPRTHAARDALYTAAVAHERLAGFELYWPAQYAAGLYPGLRFVTYDDVRRAYPDYPLPSGTYGWEPSTRTVNGRAAWPAPPKPRPRTGMERARSKIERAERRVSQAWELFGVVYGGRARAWTVGALRWTLAALVAALVLLVFRRTRRARRFLYGRLARRVRRGRVSRATRVALAPASSYAAHVPHEWGGRARAAASDTARGLLRLALHERGRAALALNLFTHALLTLLLWALVWAAKG